MKAVHELAGIAVAIVACNIEKCLRDRKWGAQLMGGICRESLLLGDMGLEPREHGVEGVGELAELIAATVKLDPVGQ